MRKALGIVVVLLAGASGCGNLLDLDEFVPSSEGVRQGGRGGDADPGGFGGSEVATGGAEPIAPAWSRALGESGTDRGLALAVDSADHAIVVGTFEGSLTVGSDTHVAEGPTDLFLIKLDPQGVPVWSRRLGGTGTELVHGIAVDSEDRIALVGEFTGPWDLDGTPAPIGSAANLFVLLFESDMTGVLALDFGDARAQRAHAVAFDLEDNLVIAGAAEGVLEFAAGAGDVGGGADGANAFVAKLGIAGEHVWSKGFGDEDEQAAHGVTVDGSGDVWLTGAFEGSVDLGGELLTADGQDVFVARLGADGAHEHSARYGGKEAQMGTDVAVGPDGSVFCTGSFQGKTTFGADLLESSAGWDIFLVQLADSGEPVLARSFGEENADGPDLALDITAGSEAIALAGAFTSWVDFGGGALENDGSQDAYLALLDSAGEHQWSVGFGRYGADVAYAVALDSAGNVLVAGEFESALTFGEDRLLSSGGSIDAFVLKFEP